MNNHKFIPSCWWMWKYFGIREMLELVVRPRLLSRLTRKSHSELYFSALQRWTDRNFKHVLEKYQKIYAEPISDDFVIWVMWWQGEKQMPEIIKSCVDSIKRNSNGHRVCFVTESTIGNYVRIPEHILLKLKNGMMTRTHFSDIVRASLLAEHGGLYIDAAIFVLSPINIKGCYYSINQGKPNNSINSLGKWVAGLQACGKRNPVMMFIRDSYSLYWSKYDTLIEFFIVDTFTRYAYYHIPQFQKAIDNLPVNSPDFSLSRYLFGKPVDEIVLRQYMNNNQFLSFTWRINYHSDKFDTYYDRMISLIKNNDSYEKNP